MDDDGKIYFDNGMSSNSIIAPRKAVKCAYERILTRADIDNEIWACTAVVKAASSSSGMSACIENSSASRCTQTIYGGWVNDHSIIATKEELYSGSNDDPAAVGQEIHYEITITNSGEGSINEILLADSLLAAKGIGYSCEKYDSVVPEGSLKCASSAPYIIEQADIDHGGVFSNVVITAKEAASGEAIPGTSVQTEVILTPNPVIEVDIRIVPDENESASAWVNGADLVTEIFLRNTGNVNLQNVMVSTSIF